jgi:Gpi18-like mannosyltransferase
LLFGFIFRIGISGFGTLQLDHGTFIAWSNNLAQNGFKTFYSGWSDYFPGYLYVLWLLGKINLLGIIPQMLYKLPAILIDVATGFLIHKILKDIKNEKYGLVGSVLYLFNPAIFGNSALWGKLIR